MSTDIELVTKALAEYSTVEAGLADLHTRYQGVVYDVETSHGMEAAKQGRAAIREVRFGVEATRKEAKAPMLKLSKRLDNEAGRITIELELLEGPIDAQIKREEGRKEAEKQAKIAAEQQRVKGLQDKIEAIRSFVATDQFAPPEVIADHIRAIENVLIGPEFAEFLTTAMDAKLATLIRLRELHKAKIDQRLEADRLKAEREELDRRRREQDEREAEITRRAQAESDRRAAEDQRIREAQAAEQWRLDAQKAEQDAREHQLRAPAPEPEPETIPSLPLVERERPSDLEIVDAVADVFGVTHKVATAWLKGIVW